MTSIRLFIKFCCEYRSTYFWSVLFGLTLVESFFIAQIIFVLPSFKIQYAVVPTLLGVTIGVLLGTVLALRKQLTLKTDIFHAIADLAFEFSFYRKPDGQFLYVSPSVASLTGRNPQSFYDNPELLREHIHPDDRYLWDEHVNEMSWHHHSRPLTMRIIHTNGEIRWMRHICSPVENELGEFIGIRSTNVDISEEIASKQKIEHLAYYDALTDLPNRRFLEKHIDTLAKEASEKKCYFGVLFVDLDRFKNINDTYGHSFGDRILRLVASRLRNACTEEVCICRFGGDEFIVITPLIEHPEKASQFAAKIISILEQSLALNEHNLYVSASIGISIYPIDGIDNEALVKQADAAMYQSKRDTFGAIHYAAEHFTNKASRVLTLETLLRKAIDHRELQLYYQPKINIRTGQCIGYEALARWAPADSDVTPSTDFITIAEETGLITSVSDLLLTELCRQVKQWRQIGIEKSVAFNLSVKQFNNPHCCERIANQWLAAELPYELLEIEVTESLFMDDFEAVVKQLQYLRNLGVKVSLDDFGTGYSSLGYLRDLPVDTLKIDRVFISKLHQSEQDEAVVRAIITLAEQFGLNVIAEGIENVEQAQRLLEIGCLYGQGYYYGKPQPASELVG